MKEGRNKDCQREGEKERLHAASARDRTSRSATCTTSSSSSSSRFIANRRWSAVSTRASLELSQICLCDGDDREPVRRLYCIVRRQLRSALSDDRQEEFCAWNLSLLLLLLQAMWGRTNADERHHRRPIYIESTTRLSDVVDVTENHTIVLRSSDISAVAPL